MLMGVHNDGTATCANCGAELPGFGVMYGLIVSRLVPEVGTVDNLIFCYINGCDELILAGHLNH